MIHQLKIKEEFFNDILSGKKTFEVRYNDRGFKEGDFLALNEVVIDNELPFPGKKYVKETGRSILAIVDYVLDDPEFVKKGFVIMSIRPRAIESGYGSRTIVVGIRNRLEAEDAEKEMP